MYDLMIEGAVCLLENGRAEKATICVKDGIIEHIGDGDPQHQAKTSINGEGCIAAPGLVNCHCHVPMTLMRGYAGDLPLEQWLFEKIMPVEEKLTYDDVYWGTIIGIMELLAGGVTLFADMYDRTDAIAGAVKQSGIKANLTRPALLPSNDTSEMGSDFRMKEALQLYYEFNNSANGRLQVDFSVHSVYTAPPQYIEFFMKKIEGIDTNIHVHLSETLTENKNCLKQYGKTPAQLMDECRVFDKNCYAAHCVHLSDHDIEILKQKNVTVVHNPTSNLKLGSGIARLPRLFKAGVNVALGTDGASSNNNLNMLEETHIASVLNNGAEHDAAAVSMSCAFNMATANGAKALRRHDTGVLEVGKKADIMLINTDKPHFLPMHDHLAAFLYSAGGGDVETTIVDGKILYNKGEFTTLDYEKAKYNVSKCMQRLF